MTQSLIEFTRQGCCDYCLSYEKPVATFSDEHDSYAACETCYRDMEQTWAEEREQ